MHRIARLAPIGLLCLATAYARQDPTICGTSRERWKIELRQHRDNMRRRAKALGVQASPAPVPAGRDIGEIAILDDADGVVARQNDFNLDQKTLTFWGVPPTAAAYQFSAGGASWDAAAASSGTPVSGLGDDDSRQFTLPFAFPFFGTSYQSAFVNSDGNLTFGAADQAASERSLGRLTAGPPRIAPLFSDLDPSMSRDSVRVFSAPDRFIVTWLNVPEYADSGVGRTQTFQLRLYPEGRIEMAYAGIRSSGAIVGISPGRLQGSSAVVDFLQGSSQVFSSTIAERFGSGNEIDTVSAAQKFYATHDDSYDYLVFYNALDINAGDGAVSWEMTVRNTRKGYGDLPIDTGAEFGSPSRLQAVLNMGPLSQYPTDPNALVPARQASRDTPVSVLAHEAGHLFLAYASVRDPADPTARPMLGFQRAHWAFTFDSEASLLEGNRIRDNVFEPQPGVTARFSTVGVTEAFSPLDQYLMGFRTAGEVARVFLATNTTVSPLRHPQLGVSFNGERRDIAVEEVIAAEGRRTPDSTVAQRRFRFAVVLIVPQGTDPSPADLQKLDTFRQRFETYFNQATSGRAWADTSLRRALRLSISPAAGVLEGRTMTASVNLQAPADQALTVYLKTQNGMAGAPSQVTIPKGATRATFEVSGLRAGVEELSAVPADPSAYETAWSRIQVTPSAASLRLALVAGGGPSAPVVLRATDVNDLPYPGLRVQVVSVSGGGSLDPNTGTTDESGIVTFRWATPPGSAAQFTARLEGGSSITIGNPAFTAAGLVNAASYQPGISPGSLGTLFGSALAGGALTGAQGSWPHALSGVSLLVNGSPAPLLLVSDQQINFLLPAETPPGMANFAVVTPVGTSATAQALISNTAPGIFFDTATGFGAILTAGTGRTTEQAPPARGDYLEIYTTGLGSVHRTAGLWQTDLPVRVFLGATEATVTFSGLAPGFQGLYQVNARVPDSVASGTQALSILVDGKRSNEVKVQIR